MNRTGISKIKRVHYKFVKGTLVSQESIETVSNADFETDANEQWSTNVYVVEGGGPKRTPEMAISPFSVPLSVLYCSIFKLVMNEKLYACKFSSLIRRVPTTINTRF